MPTKALDLVGRTPRLRLVEKRLLQIPITYSFDTRESSFIPSMAIRTYRLILSQLRSPTCPLDRHFSRKRCVAACKSASIRPSRLIFIVVATMSSVTAGTPGPRAYVCMWHDFSRKVPFYWCVGQVSAPVDPAVHKSISN
jgi:hypothetical protein